MISIYWGNPGCGKSTLACKLAKKNLKYYKHCYINFRNTVPGCHSFSLDSFKVNGKPIPLGEWTFARSSFVEMDESGIDFNNRAYKSLPKPTIAYLKKHRHYKIDMAFFSQSWEDMDVTIRRLAVEYWYLYRIGPWTLCRRVYKRTMVDKTTHQIIDGYRMASLLWLLVWPLQYFKFLDWKFTLTFRPFYYKYFDSYECDDLPVIDAPYNPYFSKTKLSVSVYFKKILSFLKNKLNLS